MTKTRSTKRALLMSALSLLLCVSMLVGSTFAWFTDSVTSAGNIIKSGTLDVEMYWANGAESPDSAAWIDASTGAIFNNDLWEPGYVEAKHIKISNVGSLALSYQLRVVANGIVSKLGDVIDVYYFEDATQLARESTTNGTKLGTLTEIFGTEKNLSKAVYGDLEAGKEKTVTIAFKMQETAGNAYQDLSIGTDFSVELLAVQHTFEKDSFDETYDEKALSAGIPAALVRELDDKDITATLGIGGTVYPYTLDAAYQFEPTQSYEELLKSEYKYYLADFIVSADRDVPADSIALAGYYDAWCQYNNDNWVALVNGGTEIEAGTEIALVETLGAAVHYKDICLYGNDGIGFLCGAADLTGENAGTTITVKLCLFETTADPNGSSASNEKVKGAEPIVIGEFKYTFPEKPVAPTAWENLDVANGDVTRSNQIAEDYVEICHKGGNLTLDNVTFEKGLTIYTNEVENSGTVTLENCTIYLSDGVPANAAYNQCNADYGLNLNLANGSDITFKFVNCTFTAKEGHNYRTDDKGYNVYIGGGYSANSITFEGCTFEGSGKHGIGCSSTAGAQYYTLTVTGCNFKNWNNNPNVTNGAAIRGNLPAADFNANINISGNTFGNSNNSTQKTVAIDSWNGTWN